MSRLPVKHTGPRKSVRVAELLAVAQLTYARVKDVWEALDAKDRAEAKRLFEKAKGDPRRLTADEQRRARDLVFKAARRAF